MREGSPAPSPQGSSSSIQTSGVTKNLTFQSSSQEHIPWNTHSISLPNNCHLSTMPESPPQPLIRQTSNASALTSLCADLSPSDSHFFEVLYIGKVKVSQRKVPDSLIDDALHKFTQYEAEKSRLNQMRRNSLLSSQAASLSSDHDSNENLSNDNKKVDFNTKDGQQKAQLSSTSTTPLDNGPYPTWSSVENIKTNDATKKKNEKTTELDQEFENFTKERVLKQNIKKPSHIALEPNVLILNVPKNNLGTVTEDENENAHRNEDFDVKGKDISPNTYYLDAKSDHFGSNTEDKSKRIKNEDLGSVISDTASSITLFCQENFLKDLTPTKDTKINSKYERILKINEDIDLHINEDNFVEKNPFIDSMKIGKNVKLTEDDKKQNPFTKDVGAISNGVLKNFAEKDEIAIGKDKTTVGNTISKDTNAIVKFKDPIANTQEDIKTYKISDKIDLNASVEDVKETDSVQVNFDEIGRKPKTLVRSKTGLEGLDSKKTGMPENKPFLRDRSASIGTLNLKTPITQLIGEQNRTMLFQVGRTELRLISPDRKQILLHKAFRDVASCVLGIGNKDHFGFICRETGSDSYVCYVFKCESNSVALEVVNAIKQAFTAHAELLNKTRERSPNMSCEHCPMLWYHRLCHDVEGMNDKRTHAFILRRVEQLPEDEQEQIIAKYQGGTNHMYEVCEHNAFLMMLLRAHCEAKQMRHVHDTAENRSEFLNQYLGGSTIFMKAKRSLSSGFDHLLKRKASQGDLHINTAQLTGRKESSPYPGQETTPELTTTPTTTHLSPDFNTRSKSQSPAPHSTGCNEPLPSPTAAIAVPQNGLTAEEVTEKQEPSNSPLMEIYLKVGERGAESAVEPGAATWRQAIFQRVLVPADNENEDISAKNLLSLPSQEPSIGKRTKEQLRELWRLAINQTILLVRMERENAKLKESEETSAVRRIKLEYTEMGQCEASVMLVWDSLLSGRDTSNHVAKVDHHMLTQAVRQGVPRMCRGGVWYFLAEQACLRSPPPDAKKFPQYHTSYHTLLAGLTKYQHAILIDLGRTFPQHSYYASSLGPGQLALYNILKAYSLLDPDVGYCQGLSFVAGVLLLHMEEPEAFVLLRHLMFRRGLRKQYLPDMSALQVQLYQMSRLLRDHEPELHAKLEALEIAPALYAAPWMLTLFTSQFPLGFVVRIFDLIFLESLDVVFAVSLSLLSAHKDGLMLCESCEEAAEYLKHKLPDIDRGIYDKVMKKVFSLDISRQLADYAVEYAVLREEMPRVTELGDANKRLTADNQRIMWDLDGAMDSISNYQKSQSRLENQVRSLESQLVCLTKFINQHEKNPPVDVKRICQNYTKKVGFGTKITSFSSKFTADDDEEEKVSKSILKTGLSTPNLFGKINKDDIEKAMHNVSEKRSPEKISMLKKSQSVNAGLIAPKLKTLKVPEEKYQRSESFRNDNSISESLKDLGKKTGGFFAQSHEQIRQERLFAQQLKHDFDENLKKLDDKLTPKNSYNDDSKMFRNQKSMSLNLNRYKVEENNNKNKLMNIIANVKDDFDSGFVTPLSPNDELKKDDDVSIVSHPLSDVDVDIKFDGHSTKLKCLRPSVKNVNDLLNRTTSIESGESKNNF